MLHSPRKIAPLPQSAPLKIKRVEAIPLELPLTKVVLMSGVRVTHGEMLLIRIETTGGDVGWGEASSAPTMTGDTLPGMTAAVEQTLAPLLAGQDALKRAMLVRNCKQALRANYSTVAAVDMALLDLLGRHFGMPVCELLGGALRDRMETMAVLGGKAIADDLAEAQTKFREGYRFFKLKVGAKPIASDIQCALELRKTLGPGVRLCADANMGLEFDAALEFVTAVAGADWFFLEQPFGKHDIARAAELARLSPVALGADEGIGSLADIVAHQRAGAAAGAALKTIKLAGVAATVHAATVCEALGLAINLSAKMAESSVAASGLVHIGAVIAETAWGVCPSNHYLADDIVKTPLRASAGMLSPPAGPGLGMEVDEAAVERYRV